MDTAIKLHPAGVATVAFAPVTTALSPTKLMAITQPEVQILPTSWISVVVSWLQFRLRSKPPLRNLTKLVRRKIIHIGFQIEN